MLTIILSFALMLVVVVLLAVGVIFKRGALKGSCGGMVYGVCCKQRNK